MPEPIPLETPIQRGEQKITEVTLRKPKAGELRGIKLVDLLNMDVGALIRVIPRISDPTLTEAEAANLDPADLTSMGTEVVGFLLTKAELATAFSQTA